MPTYQIIIITCFTTFLITVVFLASIMQPGAYKVVDKEYKKKESKLLDEIAQKESDIKKAQLDLERGKRQLRDNCEIVNHQASVGEH